jgi:hypothetical protein
MLLVLAVSALQDIAIVPFLVLLPLIESNGGMEGASADTLLQVRAHPILWITSRVSLSELLLGWRMIHTVMCYSLPGKKHGPWPASCDQTEPNTR